MARALRYKFDSNGRLERIIFPRFLYRYVAIDDRLLASIAEGSLWFSAPESFNDPFETRQQLESNNTVEEIEAYLLHMMSQTMSKEEATERTKLLVPAFAANGGEKWRAMIRLAHAERLRLLAFCCFSTVCDSILMWSHYAKGHTGLCLVYDFTDLALSGQFSAVEVEYFKQIPLFNYARERALAGRTDEFNYRFDRAVLGRKSADWAYEREVRLTAVAVGKNFYPRHALRGVIYGAKTNIYDMERIANWLSRFVGEFSSDRATLDMESHKVVVQHARNYSVGRKIDGVKLLMDPPPRAPSRCGLQAERDALVNQLAEEMAVQVGAGINLSRP